MPAKQPAKVVVKVVAPAKGKAPRKYTAAVKAKHRKGLVTKTKLRSTRNLRGSVRGRLKRKVPKLATASPKTAFEAGIVNPASARGLRFKDEGGMYPTGAISLHNVMPILQATGNKGTYGTLVPGGQFNAYLFRDVLRSMVYFDANVAGKAYSYTASFFQNGAITTTMTLDAEANEEDPLDILWMADTYALNNATYLHPHGAVLYPGQAQTAGGRKFMWLDQAAIFTVVQTTAKTASLNIYVWNGTTADLNAAPIAFAAGTAAYTAGVMGYYSFGYLDPTADVNGLTATITGNGDVFAHLTVPSVESQLYNLTGARILANSLLMSDTASAMNVEGTVHGAQFPKGTLWYDVLTPTAVDANILRFSGRAATGMYGWLKPTSTRDFDYPTTIAVKTGVVTNASFPLDSGNEFAVFIVATNGLAGASFPALDFLVTQSMALEFQTQSQWYEMEMPSLNTIQRQMAIDKLVGVPQFMENPTHLQTMWNAIKGTGGFFKKHASTITGALATMFPQYGAVFGAARHVARAF
jgi:hypothetical protein